MTGTGVALSICGYTFLGILVITLGITIPLLRRSIGTTYILALSGTINLSFTLSNVMTGGGPNGASSVLLQYMYTQGMRNANFGYAMAIAMFTLLLAIVLAMISRKLSAEKE